MLQQVKTTPALKILQFTRIPHMRNIKENLKKNKNKKTKTKQSLANNHDIHKNAMFQKYLLQKSQPTN